MHLLQVLRHTGYRLVAHMVTSWLQADYRLVTGRWQRGGRARGVACEHPAARGVGGRGARAGARGVRREACLLALALHDGEAGGRLHERGEHAGRVLVREVLRQALEGAAVGHRALDGQLELGPAQGAA